MGFLYRYLLIGVAALGLLLGAQLPSFIAQYQQRLQAQLDEVSANLASFTQVARLQLGGTIEDLITKHYLSKDPVYIAEAKAIEGMVESRKRYESELIAMQSDTFGRIWHLATAANRDLMKKTYANYNHAVIFNQETLVVSGAVMVLVVVLFELLFSILRWPFRAVARKHHRSLPLHHARPIPSFTNSQMAAKHDGHERREFHL